MVCLVSHASTALPSLPLTAMTPLSLRNGIKLFCLIFTGISRWFSKHQYSSAKCVHCRYFEIFSVASCNSVALSISFLRDLRSPWTCFWNRRQYAVTLHSFLHRWNLNRNSIFSQKSQRGRASRVYYLWSQWKQAQPVSSLPIAVTTTVQTSKARIEKVLQRPLLTDLNQRAFIIQFSDVTSVSLTLGWLRRPFMSTDVFSSQQVQ